METTQPDLSAMTLNALFAEAAAVETSPAGGCIAAVGGYLGVAVLLKCIRISARKQQPQDASYAEDEERLLAYGAQLLACAQADADSFAGFRRAIRLPKSTPEETADRKRAMQQAGVVMTTAALDILDAGNEILSLVQHFQNRLAPPVIADALGGAEMISAMNATAQGNASANLAAFSGEAALHQRFAEGKAKHEMLLRRGNRV